VFAAPFLFIRVSLPPEKIALWIMIVVTMIFGKSSASPDSLELTDESLVVGYSWVNSHSNSIGNVGVGVAIGWKRVYVSIQRQLNRTINLDLYRLLVVIGFTAAFIVMLFPNPISSRVLVRKTLAATLSEGGDIFATEVEAFLAEEALTRSRKDDAKDDGLLKDASKDDRVQRTGKRVIDIAVWFSSLYAKFLS